MLKKINLLYQKLDSNKFIKEISEIKEEFEKKIKNKLEMIERLKKEQENVNTKELESISKKANNLINNVSKDMKENEY